ncbi:MAG: MBL fold metallo-hydrolase [Bacillota bacterium]|nr:MBL fold metallo-hydrolase [Bacillota bacterium]
MKLKEKIFMYLWQGRANNCNSYIYKGEKTILFDPGHIFNDFDENCLEQLYKKMVEDGFKLEDLDYILCTHGHPDHVQSVGLLREQTGARFGIHQGDSFILEALSKHYGSGSDIELPSLQPDFYLEEGLLDIGLSDNNSADQIEVIHTPGHSPGCVCFHLPGEKALISGDTVFQGSVGRTDLPGGDTGTLGQSIEKLSGIEGIEFVLPGHMGYVKGAAMVMQNYDRIKRYFFG